ncbi:hypothetical protein CIHG_08881 [Coccidioides immitis H538.4]|uniref:Uncharacterized protein n=3 Tax=Coccidioides immitis TaxID=5501 RepID=A0A0J8R0L0_COCIT|nr:hypothetical protein CIRG_05244 [Coccidioides immitis RMSCC 2394]KMU77870.1 hypothetical protein CISG_06713 [Coccidioides immitis RMSCC 3703]KMU91132.1 hypothetical protein CIHG_08881 [Coccidioides immitis H538.4]
MSYTTEQLNAALTLICCEKQVQNTLTRFGARITASIDDDESGDFDPELAKAWRKRKRAVAEPRKMPQKKTKARNEKELDSSSHKCTSGPDRKAKLPSSRNRM